MKHNFAAVLWMSTSFLVACGPRETCPAVVEPVASIAPPPPAPPPPDRSPVAAPANLVFEAMLKQAGFGPDVLDLLGLPVVDSKTLTFALLGANVGPVVDTEAPIFAAGTVSPNPDAPVSWALSVPLLGFELVKERIERGYELVKRIDGSYLLEPRVTAEAPPTDPRDAIEPKGPIEPKFDGRPRKHFACALLPAPGEAWRLVCGENEPSVIALGPYVARTMPLHEVTAATKFVFHPNPVRAAGWIGRAFSGATSKGSLDFANYERWVNDLDQVEATIESWKTPRVVITSRYRSTTSKITESAIDDTTLGPPPRVFSELPGETKAAIYTSAPFLGDTSLVVRTLLEYSRAAGGDAERKRLEQLIETTFGRSNSFAWLSGSSFFGSFLTAVEGDDKKILGAWKGIVPTFNQIANARREGRGGRVVNKSLPLVTLGKAPSSAPANSLHIIFWEEPYAWAPIDDDVLVAGKTPKPNLKEFAHLYIVGNALGKGTAAFAFGTTEQDAQNIVEALRAGTKLGATPGAAPLMKERSGSGGFALPQPGIPPLTFFTTGNRAEKTHTLRVDLPRDQIRGAFQVMARLIFGSAWSMSRGFGFP